MGFRLNLFLTRVQTKTWALAGRMRSETWRLMVRTWAPRTWPFPVVAGLWLVFAWLQPQSRTPATFAAAVVFVAGALPWLFASLLLAIGAAFNYRAHLAHRAAHRPPRRPDGSVDWEAIDDYVLLTDCAFYDMPRTLDGLMAGPMERFIALCENTAIPIRGRARMMEFARTPPAVFKRRRARSRPAARRVDEIVLAELERRFAPQGSDGRYLVDVYLGKRTHNG